MNLHNIVGPVVAAVNPPLQAVFLQSNGYTTGPSGKRTPTYAAGVQVEAQVQALQWRDLMQLSGLNLNGEKKAIYINGNWEGVSRPDQRGGDIIVMTADSSVWLIVQVLENWAASAGWTKFAAVRQLPGGQLDVDFILDQSRLAA